MKKFLVAVLVIVIVVCSSGCSLIKSIFSGEDELYFNAAKALVAKEFPSQSFIEYEDEEIYAEDGYGRAIVYLNVTFGASLKREFYVCIKSVDEDGNYTYHPYASYVMEESEIPELKEYNDWGNPR